ncbi:MAG TPA: proline racemase family protein [Actinomycetota bacterium]
MRVATVDYHTAGEPFRIVLEGAPAIEGATVLERREVASRTASIDAYRELLVREPRGHADMYGCFVVPPDDDGAHFGALFWHKDGYSTACGHGTIALGAWAVESGRVPSRPTGTSDVQIDVPSGRVTARVTTEDGVVTRVAFENVGAYVIGRGVTVETARGSLVVDIGYGGAIYASLPAASVGMSVTPGHLDQLTTLGREIKWALNDTRWAAHPSDPRLSGIYGVIWYDEVGAADGGPHQRNVTVFADGEVDRSPCGSGTSARLALLHAEGRITVGQTMIHDSIIGTRFEGRVLSIVPGDGRDLVMTEIEGEAFKMAESTFFLDARDPVGTGFLLR